MASPELCGGLSISRLSYTTLPFGISISFSHKHNRFQELSLFFTPTAAVVQLLSKDSDICLQASCTQFSATFGMGKGGKGHGKFQSYFFKKDRVVSGEKSRYDKSFANLKLPRSGVSHKLPICKAI